MKPEYKVQEYRVPKAICHQCEFYGDTCPVTSLPCSKAKRDEKTSRWIVCGVAAIIVIVMFIVL